MKELHILGLWSGDRWEGGDVTQVALCVGSHDRSVSQREVAELDTGTVAVQWVFIYSTKCQLLAARRLSSHFELKVI